MPAIRSTGRNRKPPPAGFEDIEDTLLEFSNKMKDAQSAPHEGKKKHETLWPIMQISHQPLYEYLLKNNYADAALIAKWKKQGYEKLCCVKCIQTKETNFSSTCICRVPKATLERAEGEAGAGAGADGEDATATGGAGGGGETKNEQKLFEDAKNKGNHEERV
ncbi:hypothetical protein EPUS_06770 [Endocarpon pusillum Z07020]|uniref:Uncharacterized protein n=1 Tax=Endocarpon pusillum (strain Z07020 / HMAS-L-300199) TaxID=1263415 RepID=U1HHL8_ENDPU|nr:uncharacterized protein EPUS_06770 [Endocarpon pusillum Z07020]ERF68354.1 hypothetical protein EPUS_06770 [Endocarpon pusillum Z07020]